jgi:hypothetical protein
MPQAGPLGRAEGAADLDEVPEWEDWTGAGAVEPAVVRSKTTDGWEAAVEEDWVAGRPKGWKASDGMG